MKTTTQTQDEEQIREEDLFQPTPEHAQQMREEAKRRGINIGLRKTPVERKDPPTPTS